MRRLFSDAHYDFIGLRRRAYMVSAIALVIGIAAMLFGQFARGSWLNYGVDFTGGTLIQVQIDRDVGVGDVRGVVAPLVAGAQVTSFGDQNEFLIRTAQGGDTTSNAAEIVPAALREAFGESEVQVVRAEGVSAKVGGELQTRALIAILLSFGATLVYLAFRFEWRFGLAAVIATLHDILITLGFISVLRLEVALPTVAAVLTIVGYSLNDTIVIFDRIRENLRGAGRREDFASILNRSINDTLPRTVLTSATTLATLFALFMFGGALIREFALILIVGIILGTYSSIFVAAPALLAIEQRWPAERKKKPRVARVSTA
ncbi:MAG: protein translocase subunit SecF [Longimicrobiales bacterium]